MGRQNGYWKRHPKKDLQALLLALDQSGWYILDPPTYYKALCPCPLRHRTTIHLSPSNPRYAKEKLRYLVSTTCFTNLGGN
ncbi:hypothetical protein FB555_001818 [Alpinimonas psychrophila]|uniref:Uncharacterized protein n=1 Tax=Alpinimonas psychrophila TaxID=748908 RepID=A0A7W3JV51_9MICO|nr:hypothetical protein [Alpinimonas psychrophila]